mmetsp:Transcript_39129/g.70509  ORF Transcript_39129/g.70509 Transcript_39129/m.70509 type:complete len:206 (+) Transcript_39129:67-684(+)
MPYTMHDLCDSYLFWTSVNNYRSSHFDGDNEHYKCPSITFSGSPRYDIIIPSPCHHFPLLLYHFLLFLHHLLHILILQLGQPLPLLCLHPHIHNRPFVPHLQFKEILHSANILGNVRLTRSSCVYQELIAPFRLLLSNHGIVKGFILLGQQTCVSHDEYGIDIVSIRFNICNDPIDIILQTRQCLIPITIRDHVQPNKQYLLVQE